MSVIKKIFDEPYHGIQVNYCVSTECENFGNSDPALYREAKNDQNLNIYYCPKCGSYPQIINNQAVYQAIEHQKQYHSVALVSCPNESCESHDFAVHSNKEKYRAFGKTATLKQRYQCRQCESVFTDRFSGTNNHLEIQSALFYGMKYEQGVRNLCAMENITAKAFYKYQKNMVERLKYLAHVKEASFYRSADDCHLVTSFRFIEKATGAILIATVENDTGYVLGFDTNISKDIDKHCVLRDSKPKRRVRVQTKEPEGDLMFEILSGYDEIMSRTNYLEPMSNGKQGNKLVGEFTQPYLCSFAHALVMHNKLRHKSNRYYFVEQETMLRNAYINASLDNLLTKNAQLFYYKESNQKTERFNGDEFNIRRIGWWGDKWGIVSSGDKTKAACHIKGNGLTPQKWKALILETSFDDVDRYLSLSSNFVGSLVNTVNHHSINDWLHIYTAYYNYCLPKKNGKTPAQMMGFTCRPLGLSELLCGEYERA